MDDTVDLIRSITYTFTLVDAVTRVPVADVRSFMTFEDQTVMVSFDGYTDADGNFSFSGVGSLFLY